MKIGTTFTWTSRADGNGSDDEPVKFKVVGIKLLNKISDGTYNYFAICESVTGKYKRCFCRHDLAIAGVESLKGYFK